MNDLDKTREQLVTELIKAREHISRLQRQLIDFQNHDTVYPEMMLQCIPDGVLLFDKEGFLAEAKSSQDPFLATLFPIEHLIGHQYTEFFPDDLTEKFSETVSQAKKAPQSILPFVYETISPDGIKVSVEFWVKTFPGGSIACSFRPYHAREPGTTQENYPPNKNLLSLQEILRQIQQTTVARYWEDFVYLIHQHFGLYLTRMYLYIPSQETITLTASAGDDSANASLTFPCTSRYPAVRAFKQNQSVFIPNPAAETSIPPHTLFPAMRKLLEIPVENIGVLEIISDQDHALGESEQTTLAILAQIAQMIWKVQLEKDALEKQKEFYFLEREIKERITQTQSVDEALQVTLQELSKALGIDRAEIRLNLASDRKAASLNE